MLMVNRRTLAAVASVFVFGLTIGVIITYRSNDSPTIIAPAYNLRLTLEQSHSVVRRLVESLPLHGFSHHKDLFPLDNNDYMGLFFVIIGLMIAAAGGIGGGGIVVPLLIIVFEFEPKYAIPLSNFTILGCSLMNVYLNTKKRHPNVDRPLVDWDLIMVMEPLTVRIQQSL